MASPTHPHRYRAHSTKVVTGVLFSMVIFLLYSPAAAQAPDVQDSVGGLPPGKWLARYPEQGSVNAGEEIEQQRVLEAWSGRYNRQGDLQSVERAAFQRGREAWTARYQFQ